jgi:hypothetical protein
MTSFRSGISLLPIVLLLGCGGDNTSSNVKSPGEQTSAKTRTLAAGADLLQDKAPLRQLTMYLDGFHFYNGDQRAQMEAHHFCSTINEDVTHCVIYDGNGENAKIMGVEYIISEKLFATLPADEKRLWHSHVYEVKSGELIAPGIPDVAEHELMEKLVSTYGKTFHTWHTDQEFTLPTGHPMVMMGFTKDGQIDPKLLSDRDRRFGVSTEAKKKNRATIPSPAVQPGANAWQQGNVVQLELTKSATATHSHRAARQ